MGQSWRIVDLDGCTQIYLGKLGESLPHESTTAHFIHYLRRPLKRAVPDSPSKEQVERWLALCTDPPKWPAPWISRKCEPAGLETDHEERTVVITSELRPIRTSIQTMPVDIHLLIFDMLEEFADVLCLALTSEQMFRSGEKRILATAEDTVPWAGHRLICVGHCLMNKDVLPTGLLTSEEQEELDHGILEEDDESGSGISIYDLAESRFPRVYKKRPLQTDFYDQFVISRSVEGSNFVRTRINTDVFTEIVKWLDGKSKSKPMDDGHRLILRNLTKRQYVRAIATSTALGTVLLARICWSSVPDTSMDDPGHDLTRGVWAGDRFDITTLDRLEEDARSPGVWTDVSKEVDDEMARIWECEYGAGWKDKDRW